MGGQAATVVVASALPRAVKWFRIGDLQGCQTLSRWWAKEVTVHNDVSVGSLSVVLFISPGHS